MRRPSCFGGRFVVSFVSPPLVLWILFSGGIFSVVMLTIAPSAQSVPSTKFESSLAPLAEWVKQTGKPTVIRGPVLHVLGFPDADVSVLERGFRGAREQFTHVCSISPANGFEDVVFLALVDENNGNATVWRATLTGQLKTSARFIDGEARPISNAETQVLFISEKAYLTREMRLRWFRINPAKNPGTSLLLQPTDANTRGVVVKPRRNAVPSSELLVLLIKPCVIPILLIGAAIGVYRASRPARRP